MRAILPGAEPFAIRGGPVGCLLVHGFTASPQEMRQLGRFLGDAGYSVLGVLLAGHGTHVEELQRTAWRDWYASVTAGWGELQASSSAVFAIGQSLGGSLCLHLAAHVPVAGVVTMASPLITSGYLLLLARAIQHIQPYRKKGPSNLLDSEARARRVAYTSTPVRSQEQALRFFRHLQDDLPDVRAPVLSLHSRQDKTVSPADMAAIHDRLGSHDKEMVWLERSGHIVTEDYDHELAYTKIQQFITRLSAAHAGTTRESSATGQE
jgi:carboxylesterase